MATSEFVEVAASASAVEAEYLRSVLVENGVAAFIDGAAANTALSYVGTALGGVRVFVRAADAETAREIVEEVRAGSDGAATSWFCGTCEETVAGSFDVCWSCGQERAQVERPFPEAGERVESADDRGGDDPTDGPIPDYSAYDAANPYASPMTREAAMPDGPQGEISEAAEEMLHRAWRASVIGIILFPFVLHLYSTYLLIRATTIAPAFSPEGEKRFYRAIVINVLAACVCGLMFALTFG